jgi:hypothetical protein
MHVLVYDGKAIAAAERNSPLLSQARGWLSYGN